MCRRPVLARLRWFSQGLRGHYPWRKKPALGRSVPCLSRGSWTSPSVGSRLGLVTAMTALRTRMVVSTAGTHASARQFAIGCGWGLCQASHPERTGTIDVTAERIRRRRAAAGVRHSHDAFGIRSATNVVSGGSRRLPTEVAGRFRVLLAHILPHVRKPIGSADGESRDANRRRRRAADRAHPGVKIV